MNLMQPCDRRTGPSNVTLMNPQETYPATLHSRSLLILPRFQYDRPDCVLYELDWHYNMR